MASIDYKTTIWGRIDFDESAEALQKVLEMASEDSGIDEIFEMLEEMGAHPEHSYLFDTAQPGALPVWDTADIKEGMVL